MKLAKRKPFRRRQGRRGHERRKWHGAGHRGIVRGRGTHFGSIDIPVGISTGGPVDGGGSEDNRQHICLAGRFASAR